MIDQLLHSPQFSDAALYMYYGGAFFWLLAYAMAVYRIVKKNFLEFPALVIAGNVAWEFLFGFVFPLDFGGPIMLWSWRAGLIMDIFMLYTAFRLGASQTDIPAMKKFMPIALAFTFVVSFGGVYYYVKAGYELPMGFNSAMILNVVESVLCLLFLLRRPDIRFSPWIGIARMIATDIFLAGFIIISRPDVFFPVFLCGVCLVLDLTFVILAFRKPAPVKARG